MLLSIPFVQTVKTPHHRSANHGNDYGNPPIHQSHPTRPNRLSPDASIRSLLHLMILTFLDCRSMKICFSMRKTKINRLNMTFEANMTPTRDFIAKFSLRTANAFKRFHTKRKSLLPTAHECCTHQSGQASNRHLRKPQTFQTSPNCTWGQRYPLCTLATKHT